MNTATTIVSAGFALGVLWGLFRDLFTRHLIDGRCRDCAHAAVRRTLSQLQGFRP